MRSTQLEALTLLYGHLQHLMGLIKITEVTRCGKYSQFIIIAIIV